MLSPALGTFDRIRHHVRIELGDPEKNSSLKPFSRLLR